MQLPQLKPQGSSQYWDNFSKEYTNETERDAWQKQYVKALYLKIVAQTIQPDWSVLKVDLWNEGIEQTRSILNYLSSSSIGFDISKQVCHKAKHNINQEIAQASCMNLPYKTGHFHAVLDLSTIDHIPVEFAPKIFHEYHRILKPDGVLSMVFWQDSFPTKFLQPRMLDQYYFDQKTLHSLLEDSGFLVQRAFNIGSLLTLTEFNKAFNCAFWQLKKVLKEHLIDLALNFEFNLPNLLGGLRVIYAKKPF
jgi:SAM-dependent methyltransferase